jgi:hypothetical protein
MNKLIEYIANAAAVLGVALIIVAGLTRVLGLFYLGNIQVMTVYSGGMGLTLIGIVGKLHGLKRTI